MSVLESKLGSRIPYSPERGCIIPAPAPSIDRPSECRFCLDHLNAGLIVRVPVEAHCYERIRRSCRDVRGARWLRFSPFPMVVPTSECARCVPRPCRSPPPCSLALPARAYSALGSGIGNCARVNEPFGAGTRTQRCSFARWFACASVRLVGSRMPSLRALGYGRQLS